MIEAGALIDQEGKVIYWHTPAGRSTIMLPDSPGLWDVIWRERGRLAGFAHTHPGSGRPGPSMTDITTFAAIEAALGKRLDWWILSKDDHVVLEWKGPDKHEYVVYPGSLPQSWFQEIRKISGYFETFTDS